jgi:hypothetical protein
VAYHEIPLYQHRIYWNLLLPGDIFALVDDEQPTIPVEIGNVTIHLGSLCMVVSRRIGMQYPTQRDYYVFLISGTKLTDEVLL